MRRRGKRSVTRKAQQLSETSAGELPANTIRKIKRDKQTFTKGPSKSKKDSFDVFYEDQAETEKATTNRHDSITDAVVPVYDAPEVSLALRPLSAASSAVADDNAAVATAAQGVHTGPAGDSGVDILEESEQVANTALAIRTRDVASTALADGNAGVVAVAEGVQVNPASDGGVDILGTAEQAATKPDLLLRPLISASSASASGNGTVVAGEESVPASPASEDYDAHDDIRGKELRRTVTPPPDPLAVRLICTDCHIDPPNLVERDDVGDVVCEDCGLVLMSGVYY